jgi:hypothetical protein
MPKMSLPGGGLVASALVPTKPAGRDGMATGLKFTLHGTEATPHTHGRCE